MCRRILTLLLMLSATLAASAQARVMSARIDRITTGVATLHDVRIDLKWPAGASHGELRVQARRLEAPDLGYAFEQVSWRCRLRREWQCAGPVESDRRGALQLAVDLSDAATEVRLSSDKASVALQRRAATPDLTRLDLTRIPLPWVQALLAQAWPEATLTSGTVSGPLMVEVPGRGPVHVQGRLGVGGLGLDTPDGRIAAEGLDARLDVDYRKFDVRTLVTVDGEVGEGEVLWGNSYVALGGQPALLSLAAARQEGEGWQVPGLTWDDGEALRLEASLGFGNDVELDHAQLDIASARLDRLGPRYLSGWLGQWGLAEVALDGEAKANVVVQAGALARADVTLDRVSLRDAQGRFGFNGIAGTAIFSGGAVAKSGLRWEGGQIGEIAFGAAKIPLSSGDGHIGLREPVRVAMLGGQLVLEALDVRTPAGDRGLEVEFGLALQSLDVGQLASAMDWPAFTGRLDGRVPKARYANDRLVFDGTLTAQTFGGTVAVSGLSMERPFGPAPTLEADIVFDDMDLQALTSVFGFGEITGALDGSVRGLRLVDWSAQAFDAQLRTDDAWKGRRRISQRAVQDLSSVGGTGGLGDSLQAQALQLFDDFGYRRIGISCRLANEVCVMDGLGSVGAGFSIVQGSGLPRLRVVGFNRRVDWPVLVDRLVAVTQGESTPIIE